MTPRLCPPVRQGAPWLLLRAHTGAVAIVPDAIDAEAVLAAQRERVLNPPSTFAGLLLDRPRLMGILNVTPDSFSDGGEAETLLGAVTKGRALWEAGADLVDVGGESTRPGAEMVPVQQELDRVIPVVEALVAEGIRVSVDTRHAAVMAAVLDAGAAVINDVSALTDDPDALPLVAARRCPVVLMHKQGQPATMQDDPSYGDVVLEVADHLEGRVQACLDVGLTSDLIAVDPGIGFGKTLAHNLDLLAHLGVLRTLGCAVLVGASRKRMIEAVDRPASPHARLGGSLAIAAEAIQHGVHWLRVHDVAETRQALAVVLATRAALRYRHEV